MAIDQRKETLLSLTDATKAILPIDGKRPHVSTVWRWCRRGVRGVHLVYVRLGRRVGTSAEAFARFAQRPTDADARPDPPIPRQQPKSRSGRARRRSIERANAALDKAGI